MSPGYGHSLFLGTVTGAAKVFEIGGVCVHQGDTEPYQWPIFLFCFEFVTRSYSVALAVLELNL